MKHRQPLNNSPLPTEPGDYFWTEWQQMVKVYRKGRHGHLYVKPVGGVEVRISPRIAGRFLRRLDQEIERTVEEMT